MPDGGHRGCSRASTHCAHILFFPPGLLQRVTDETRPFLFALAADRSLLLRQMGCPRVATRLPSSAIYSREGKWHYAFFCDDERGRHTSCDGEQYLHRTGF